MIISKLKSITIAATITFCSSAFAMSDSYAENGCSCAQSTCTKTETKSPSWWNWITGSQNGSQFHFFDLIELLHTNDKVETSQTETDDKENDSADA